MARPKRISFPVWMERTIHLPLGLAATPGQMKLAPYWREVASAMVDPTVEKITVVKSAQVGFSTLLSGLIGWHLTEQPAAILVVVPAEQDARNYVVALEDTFACSPALEHKLPTPSTAGRDSRNTLLYRRGTNGASLRLVGANAPRNLRAIVARIILIDEADALQDTEGDVVMLAESRSLSFPDKRTVIGGTPLVAETSRIAKSYAESDQGVWQVPCPRCGTFSELQWPRFEWPAGRPDQIAWRCPECAELIDERHKAGMARNGRWHVLRPEAGSSHRGFKISSLASSLPQAAWSKLAAQFEAARDDPERMKAFVNTRLGEPWFDEGSALDESTLAARAEPFGPDAIPPEVLALTAGVDCADDRLEAVIVGWSRGSHAYVLSHEVIWGAIDDDLTWQQLDDLLRQRWHHPLGGQLKLDAVAIDGGDGGHLDQVMGFCRPRASRRVLAIKGAPGFSRPPLLAARSKMKGGGRLWIVGSDSIKSRIFDHLHRGKGIRFSETLPGVFYEQLSSERIVLRTRAGKPLRSFERIKGAKAEALDAMTYAWAARSALSLSQAAFDQREASLSASQPTPRPSDSAPPTTGARGRMQSFASRLNR